MTYLLTIPKIWHIQKAIPTASKWLLIFYQESKAYIFSLILAFLPFNPLK